VVNVVAFVVNVVNVVAFVVNVVNVVNVVSKTGYRPLRLSQE
jgi:hypothetical protein